MGYVSDSSFELVNLLKVALVTGSYHPFTGGIETHVKEIGEGLVTRGLDVVVLTTDRSSTLPLEETINGVKIKRFKCWAPKNAYFFSRSLKKYLSLNSSSFDIVHAHSYHSFPALYAAQAKAENHLVFTPHYHGTGNTFFRSVLHKPYKFLAKTIFDKADSIINVSNFERKLILENFKVDETKVTYISNGVRKAEFEDYTHLKRPSDTILSVGRLEKYKGLQYLIAVLPKLDQHVTLEIVGNGPYKNSLINLAERLGVASRVKFYGYVPRIDLLQKYAQAGIFCLLSEHESYGIVVAEALCAGTPCVVTNNSALVEWVDNENCIGLDSPKDLNALQVCIRTLMGKRARGANILDWTDVVTKVANTYKELCA